MTTRNEGGRVRRTIDSLLANTFYPDFEVIVLDDASDDGSCDFFQARPYARDGRLRLVRGDRQRGYLALRCEGARLATGSILQFLDAHHCFSPYWLTNLYDRLRQHEFRALVGPVVSVLDPASWQLTRACHYGWGFDESFESGSLIGPERVLPGGKVTALVGHQIMIERSAYETIGGFWPWFRGHNYEDVELCLRAFLLGYDCYVEPTAMIGHLFKDQLINPVSWGDVAFNYLAMVYLGLGEQKLAAIKGGYEHRPGYEEATALLQHLRPEIEQSRRWILDRQRRTVEELLAQIALSRPRPPAVSLERTG
jgi:glycosyltransferase involved in cell wall biosynthesis